MVVMACLDCKCAWAADENITATLNVFALKSLLNGVAVPLDKNGATISGGAAVFLPSMRSRVEP